MLIDQDGRVYILNCDPDDDWGELIAEASTFGRALEYYMRTPQCRHEKAPDINKTWPAGHNWRLEPGNGGIPG